MIYNNKTTYPTRKQLEIKVLDFAKGIDSITGENVTDFDYAVSSYNFNFNSGVLTEGIGFKNLSFPLYTYDATETKEPILPDGVEIESLWHFKHFGVVQQKRLDKIMFYGKNNTVYYGRIFTALPEFFSVNELQMSEKPFAFNQKIYNWDNIILSNGVDDLITWNGESIPISYPNAPKIVALCEHKGKLYATVNGERNFIRYSANTNINEWLETQMDNGDGLIEMNDMRGPINHLLSFQGYLYAFRDYGISKITTYENSDNIVVSQLFSSGNKIYPNTVEICGDTVLMLNKDGIFEFDGISTEKLDLKINNMFKGVFNENAVATYHSGVYYLACKLNYADNNVVGCENGEYKNNTLIAFDVKKKTYSIIRGIDITSLATIQIDAMDKVVFCYNSVYTTKLGEISQSGKFFDDNTEKYWCSPLSDLGYSDKIKVATEISLISKYDCTVKVFSESEEKTIKIKGGNLMTKNPIRIRGKQIGFSISTNCDKAYISNVKLKVDLVDYDYN